jgi:hypothetical protein
MLAETIDDSIDRFNSIVSRFFTFLLSRYVARYYIINKKLKVLFSRQNNLGVFLLNKNFMFFMFLRLQNPPKH